MYSVCLPEQVVSEEMGETEEGMGFGGEKNQGFVLRLVGSEISYRNWRRNAKNAGRVMSVGIREGCTKMQVWRGIASLRGAKITEVCVGAEGGSMFSH